MRGRDEVSGRQGGMRTSKGGFGEVGREIRGNREKFRGIKGYQG